MKSLTTSFVESCKCRAWTVSGPLTTDQGLFTLYGPNALIGLLSQETSMLGKAVHRKSRGHTVSSIINAPWDILNQNLKSLTRKIALITLHFIVWISTFMFWRTFEKNQDNFTSYSSDSKYLTIGSLVPLLWILWVIHMDLGQPPYCLVTRGNI